MSNGTDGRTSVENHDKGGGWIQEVEKANAMGEKCGRSFFALWEIMRKSEQENGNKFFSNEVPSDNTESQKKSRPKSDHKIVMCVIVWTN